MSLLTRVTTTCEHLHDYRNGTFAVVTPRSPVRTYDKHETEERHLPQQRERNVPRDNRNIHDKRNFRY